MLKFLLVVLYMIAILGIGFGANVIMGAKGALQQGEGFTIILTGVVALGAVTIATAILRLTDHVERGNAEAALARRDASPRRQELT